MRILFVHPGAPVSISDVGRGYRQALERQGHEVRDYHILSRIDYHRAALPPEIAGDIGTVSRLASETIVVEALCSHVDLVLIICGLNVHPIALWLLGQVKIPAAVILTESPYDDESQKQWTDLRHVDGHVDLTVFTNDMFSAHQFGWHFLPPAYDPSIHRPVEPDPMHACDVVMVGTGFGERQSFLEAVNWDGINLHLWGVWPGVKADSPLHEFYRPSVVDNSNIAAVYCSAKICLNLHRRSSVAATPGPRVYELAACRAFQLSDARDGLVSTFGASIPTFSSPERLEELIRYYLLNDSERLELADDAYRRVHGETFDTRVRSMMAVIEESAHFSNVKEVVSG
jgi:spore maturation protein CgeB